MIQAITKESIIKAIQRIDSNSKLKKGRESVEYDLVYNGKNYPPILVLSEANKIQGGEDITIRDFNNSTNTAFKILEKQGFVVKKKGNGYYQDLVAFIQTAKQQTTGQGTTEEAKIFNQSRKTVYSDLKVDVSFGIGRATAIPWISFLGDGQKTSKGIYPVYLFFKDENLLILAYGVSENNKPKLEWNIPNLASVNEFFRKKNLGNPDKYGTSYLFKSYNTLQPLNQERVDKDLNDIIKVYKEILGMASSNTPNPSTERFNYNSFHESAIASNFQIDKRLTLRFTASLLTKPFVILTGLAGSGKTKLAQTFAKWISKDDSQICIAPVGADWTNREPLLGFVNALDTDKYVIPENGVLQLIIEANKPENKHKPYFLILDEMNLSHVERYFADFLSEMESKEGTIKLHTGTIKGVPQKIDLPNNLFIIGTVNVDETTYMFSPKVLDRANVIEFRVTEDEMKSYLQTAGSINIDTLKGVGASMASDFVKIASDSSMPMSNKEMLASELLKFFNELKKTGAEFGYRSAAEIMRFAATVENLDDSWSMTEILDAAIMQKLLPKVHGSRKKLSSVLESLGNFCLNEEKKISDVFESESDVNYPEIAKYPVSLEKLTRIYRNLMANGFTSYAEA